MPLTSFGALGRLRYDGEAVWYDGGMMDTGVPLGASSGSALRGWSLGGPRYDGEAVWYDGGMTDIRVPLGSLGSQLWLSPRGWSLGHLRYDGEAVWYDGGMTETGVAEDPLGTEGYPGSTGTIGTGSFGH